MVEIEERLDLIKERILLLDNTLLKQQRVMNQEIKLIKEDILGMKNELEEMKSRVSQILDEREDFARREELAAIESFIRIWQPVKFIKEEDVKSIIRKQVKKVKN